jgi:S1-C subfamily serine protease
MVDNLVVGGPAYNSRQLHHGDVIVKVDGIPITASNIHEVMVGDDVPGAPVVVSVARGGPKVL